MVDRQAQVQSRYGELNGRVLTMPPCLGPVSRLSSGVEPLIYEELALAHSRTDRPTLVLRADLVSTWGEEKAPDILGAEPPKNNKG